MMEGNSNWKPNEQGGYSLASNNANDWRSQLQPDMRKEVISAIVEKFKIYYPSKDPIALENTALSLEGKVHAVATDKDDYMQKSRGILMNIDRKFRTAQSNNVQPGSSVNGTNPPAPAAQTLNQGSVPTSSPYTQTPRSQQWLPQNIQSNLNIPESSGLPTQVSMTAAAQNQNNQMGEGVHSNLHPSYQRQVHGREHYLPQQQQQSSNYFQNQMDQQPLKQRRNVQPPYTQQLPHQTPLSSIQQSFPQPSALSTLPSSGQQNSRFLSRQNQFPAQRVHSSHHHQQQMSVPYQEPKREQLISHLMNVQDTQQNHLTFLQNNREQQRAFRVSSSQQNNIASFQERPHQINTNIQNMYQQQRLYSHSNNASALPSQQQQYNLHGSSSLAAQGQEVGQSQPMIQQQYKPQRSMQQKQPQNIILQKPLDDKQRFQGSLRQTGYVADQQNQPYQLQRTPQANPSRQTVNNASGGGGDWREETYQKIQALKEKYLPELDTMFQKITYKLREIDSKPQQKIPQGPIEKLRTSRETLKHVLVFINVPRNGITELHRDKFSLYEQQLLRFVKPNQTVTTTRSPVQQQQQQVNLPPPQTHETTLQSQSGHQFVHVLDNHQNGDLSSVSVLTTSHSAKPHSLQKRPKMEPKEDSNIMTSSLPSLKQNLASNSQPSMYQQKQFHHLPMEQKILKRKHQQLQIPKNEMNDVRMNQQHLSSNQRHLEKPLASPAASSPQIQSHSSPQVVDQQSLPTTLNKTGTSPFVEPPPVTSIAPSPNLGDSENPITVESPAAQEHPPSTPPPEPNTERPIDRLIKAIQSSSPESLAQSVSEMSTVISLTDRLAGSVQSIGWSKGGLAQDLSETTRLRLQQGETNKRFKRTITTQPIDITLETDSYKRFSSLESEVDSTASSGSKVNKVEPGGALLREIKEVNGRLVETVVNICNEDVSPFEVTTGTIVTCSYSPVAICDTFQALYKSGHISQIQPLRLLVPENYPQSPILIENIPCDSSEQKHEDFSARTITRFGLSMKEFSEPMSLTEIAQAWDACARATMAEYAERHGGGTFSSKYGQWEPVLRA